MKKQKKTFTQLVSEAKKLDYSLGAEFMRALKGKKCYYKHKPIDKWELWAMGYKNADLILMGMIDKIEAI